MLDTAPSGPLLDRTLYLVKNRPFSIKLEHIAGPAQVSVPWISRFAHGHIKDPSVNAVQRVHDVLVDLIKGLEAGQE